MSSSTEQPVLYEQDGPIALITLNRPASLNAINPPLRDGLDEVLERVRDDKSVRVAINSEMLAGATFLQVQTRQWGKCFLRTYPRGPGRRV